MRQSIRIQSNVFLSPEEVDTNKVIFLSTVREQGIENYKTIKRIERKLQNKIAQFRKTFYTPYNL